jgi:hypothetical protein
MRMVRIRYAELPAGLHVRVEAGRRRTVIYLKPGLTAGQRRAALMRARSSGRMGYGPRLPAAELAAAMILDRVVVLWINTVRAVRARPALVIPVALVIAAAVLLVLVSPVRIEIDPHATAGHHLLQATRPTPELGDRRGGPGHQNPVSAGSSGSRPGSARSSPAGPSPARHSPSPTAGPHPSSSPASPSPGGGGPAPSASPAPSATGSPAPSPAPSPSASVCLVIGPLGICL